MEKLEENLKYHRDMWEEFAVKINMFWSFLVIELLDQMVLWEVFQQKVGLI